MTATISFTGVVVCLLAAWATRKYDREVFFLAVVMAVNACCAIMLRAALLDTGLAACRPRWRQRHGPITRSARSRRWKSGRQIWWTDRDRDRFMAVLVAALAAGVWSMGAMLFRRSPALGVLLYAMVISAAVHDESHAPYNPSVHRVTVFMVLLMCVLSRHVLRLNVAAGAFAAVVLEARILRVGSDLDGADFVTLCLAVGIVANLVHDLCARFLVAHVMALGQSVGVACTALVIGDVMLELVRSQQAHHANGSPKRPRLLLLPWNAAFLAEPEALLRQGAHANAVLVPSCRSSRWPLLLRASCAPPCTRARESTGWLYRTFLARALACTLLSWRGKVDWDGRSS